MSSNSNKSSEKHSVTIRPVKENSHSTVQVITICSDHADRRIDNFIGWYLKGLPKSRIYRLLRKGEIRVNKKRIKPDYRLAIDDVVRIPPVRLDSSDELIIPQKMITLLEQSIIYMDDHLLALNKPSGIPVHAGSGLKFGAIDILRASPYANDYLELAHRLDRETSGCLLLARTPPVLRELNQVLQQKETKKHYIALIKGRWNKGEMIVDAPLLKNTLRGGERFVEVNEAGKSARTEFIPLEYYEDSTLVELILHTGRTHQIRVHAAYMGHPLAADKKYGDKEYNKIMKKQGLKRMFLHAHSIKLSLEGKQPIDIEAPLPAELASFLEESLNKS